MSSQLISYAYSYFYTPSISYRTCRSSPPSLDQQRMSTTQAQTFHCSPPSSPFFSNSNHMVPSIMTTQPVLQQPLTSKTTQLQYSNKHRYILNELFKRTPYPN
ncbi:unnamed protein product, partial [Rotaria sp. Silwood2]